MKPHLRFYLFLVSIVLLAACKKSEEPALIPTITGFTPTEGPVGTTVTVTGTNFNTEVTKMMVKIGAVVAVVNSSTATEMKVVVPVDGKSGTIDVTINGQSASSASSFTVLGKPLIISLQPASGKAGDVIKIVGTNFSPVTDHNTIKYNDLTVATASATNTELTFTVPANGKTGSVTVTTASGTSNGSPFSQLVAPTGFSPASGAYGSRVKIQGSGMNFLTTVFFGTTVAPVISDGGGTELTVAVPQGATTGKIKVGGVQLAQDFTVVDALPVAKAPFPGAKRISATGFRIGNDLFYGLGSDETYNFLNDFWKYSITNNTWTQVASLPVATGLVSSTAFSVGGKGYIVGGATKSGLNSVMMNKVWQFDPVANQWNASQDFPGAARRSAVAFVIGNLAYVGLGGNGTTFFNDLWQFDPVNVIWTQKASYSGTSWDSPAAFTIGNVAYIAGGVTVPANDVKSTWSYNPAANAWTKLTSTTPFSGALSKYCGFTINGIGYVATEGHLYQYVPLTDPNGKDGIWITVQTSPTSQEGNVFRSADQGGYLANDTNAYLWYGGDLFWMFTPPQ
jgi:hypothetical protein